MHNLGLFILKVFNRISVDELFYKLLQTILVLVIAKIAKSVLGKLIARIFRARQLHGHLEERRAKTLSALLRSIVSYLIYFITIVTILQFFNVPVGSVLTTAGIAGVAVAFGAQSLVRDMITGFFILLENQFQVGDRVYIADVTGTVEEIGFRVTKVRDFGGQLHIIPNGKIERVTNFNGPAMLALADIPVAYENNLAEVIALLQECLDQYNKIHPELVEPAILIGLQALSEFAVLLRVQSRTAPGRQWQVERELRQLIIETLNVHGVKHPPVCNYAGYESSDDCD